MLSKSDASSLLSVKYLTGFIWCSKKREALPFKGRRITIVAFTRRGWITLPPDEQESTCHKRKTLEEQSSVKCYLRVRGVPSISVVSTCHKTKNLKNSLELHVI